MACFGRYPVPFFPFDHSLCRGRRQKVAIFLNPSEPPGPNCYDFIMNLEQMENEIRRLNPSERIKLYRWFDYVVAVDFHSSDFCSRIGTGRSLEIRQAIEQMKEITLLGHSPGTSSSSLQVPK
jgi:hypothetical protein